jgi:hypothetical protein
LVFITAQQFSMTFRSGDDHGQFEGVRRVALFVSMIYVRHWHEAVSPIRAPLNDVRLILTLEQYPDKMCREPAIRAVYRHLWNLAEDLVGLAFLDDRIDVAEKSRMQTNLKRPQKGSKRLDGKGLKIGPAMSDFVTERTRGFFESLQVVPTFLDENPALWEEDASFALAVQRASSLQVVNDAAERGIALIEKFTNKPLSREEDQLQFLLQTVHHHRKVMKRSGKKEDLFEEVF